MGQLVLGAVGLAALVAKVTDFFRLIANLKTEKSAVVTQVLAWLGGIVAISLYANSDFGSSVDIGAKTLNLVDGPSLVILGLMAASFASVAIDFKQAKDNADSAAKPPLIGP